MVGGQFVGLNGPVCACKLVTPARSVTRTGLRRINWLRRVWQAGLGTDFIGFLVMMRTDFLVGGDAGPASPVTEFGALVAGPSCGRGASAVGPEPRVPCMNRSATVARRPPATSR